MRIPLLGRWIGALGLATGLAGCIVHDTPTVNPGYGDGYGYYPDGTRGAPGASVVGEPTPAYVSGMPPEPLYEQMSDSPADGSVWIDGYWHWNSYEWVWVQGRWEHEQQGYVYVEPNYDYVGDQYVYTPGYWSQPERAPRGWNVRDHRDGRPTIIAPPVGSGGYRPPIAVGTRHPVRGPAISGPGRPGNDGEVRPPRGGARVPAGAPPVYDPRGGVGGTWRPAPRRPIGVFNGPQPTGGPIGGGSVGGGAVGGPARGGTIFGGPNGGPTTPPVAAPTTPPPIATTPPPTQPAPQPVWVPAPAGGIGRPTPPPPMGRPIYVNPPGPAGDQQRGARQPGGPIYVQPAGPQAPTSPPPGSALRPTPVAPPVHVAPPPPPPPPSPAPGPRSTNARRPQ